MMMTQKHVTQQESGYGEERRKRCIPTMFRSYWLRIYREMMRMSYESFKKVLGFIEPYITPKDSAVIGTQLIRPGKRLMLAIRFLATGETYRSLSLQFRVSERAISYIIDEVTKAIVYSDKTPSWYRLWIFQLQKHLFHNLAVAGPDYECVYADIGSNGRMNDSE